MAHILILFLIVCKVENIVKWLWMIYYCLHQANKVHMDKLEDLLKALRKNGLKISPKKCQLFRTGIAIYGKYNICKGEKSLC